MNLSNLTDEQLNELHLHLSECLDILNMDEMSIVQLSNMGLDKTLQLELMRINVTCEISRRYRERETKRVKRFN